ncbi:hypothetical protein J1792_18770 [Streptomyces triculaminicus]|uniref:Uncharacterized protein n=2 Tax=Streptomyces TaxID=1883 RepID=A0A939FQ53_9ACTN|nr:MULTISPECIES: hypothetical protein [Streptomyces]MBO0654741.1 hypothetical protein [Streptomyces triculaminicus]QSY51346.1 hypothetical protein J3S04_10970 [Streptomyces griseocarneus]
MTPVPMVPGLLSCSYETHGPSKSRTSQREGWQVMFGPGDEAFETASTEFDPDAVIWVPDVDYVSGWREAQDAAAELSDALGRAGVDLRDAIATAQTRADGSGVVRLLWPVGTVQAVAELVRREDLREAG